MNEETEVKGLILDQKEKIKLMKMSKGYQWEITILPMSTNFLLPTDTTRLQELDKLLRETYGGFGE